MYCLTQSFKFFFFFFCQTQVSTLICDPKQLKKLTAISSSLKTIKNVIYFEDETEKDSSFSGSISNWKISSFSEVEKLGKVSPVPPNLPSKNGIAVTMYTSGSTGLPKVCSHSLTIVPSILSQICYICNLSTH